MVENGRNVTEVWESMNLLDRWSNFLLGLKVITRVKDPWTLSCLYSSTGLLFWSFVVEKDVLGHMLSMLNWKMSYNSFKCRWLGELLWLSWVIAKCIMMRRHCLDKGQTQITLPWTIIKLLKQIYIKLLVMFYKVSPNPFFDSGFSASNGCRRISYLARKTCSHKFYRSTWQGKKAWVEAENFHMDRESLGIQPSWLTAHHRKTT